MTGCDPWGRIGGGRGSWQRHPGAVPGVEAGGTPPRALGADRRRLAHSGAASGDRMPTAGLPTWSDTDWACAAGGVRSSGDLISSETGSSWSSNDPSTSRGFPPTTCFDGWGLGSTSKGPATGCISLGQRLRSGELAERGVSRFFGPPCGQTKAAVSIRTASGGCTCSYSVRPTDSDLYANTTSPTRGSHPPDSGGGTRIEPIGAGQNDGTSSSRTSQDDQAETPNH